ncbi:hypothetical protein [Streptomyces sp. DH18]|uniref:hypothetical protein n=1 Tax=Streptomyces sp. DH18 TaxID=3040126 RepID=UPI0030152170
MSQEALADAVEYSYEQTASIEQGRRPAKARFTECAEEVLGAGEGWGRAAGGGGSGTAAPVLPELRGAGGGGAELLLVQGYVFSGLPQTEEYARAILQGHFPPSRATCSKNVSRAAWTGRSCSIGRALRSQRPL